MTVLIIIFVIILSIQLVLALFAWGSRRQIEQKFSHPTGEGREPAQIIEEYYRNDSTKFRIQATDEIYEPAFAEEDFLLINKDKIYKKDLYTNFYVIFQAEMTKKDYRYLRIVGNIQSFIFLIEIIVFLISIATTTNLKEVLIYVSIGLQILSFILTLLGFIQIDTVLEDASILAKMYLRLDDVEEARVMALKGDLRYIVFEYPFEVIWRLVQFFR
ncbi:MAG: hypothetical protein ABIM99_03235 [Candidatus Dojkabacteria bacterium]